MDLKKIEDIIDPKIKYRYMFSKKLFRITDKNTDKVCLEGKYQTIGIYDSRINFFYRSDSILFIDKQEYSVLLKNIESKKKDLEIKFKNKKINSYDLEKFTYLLDNKDFYCTKECIKELVYLFSEFGEFVFEIPEKGHESKIRLILLLDIRKI